MTEIRTIRTASSAEVSARFNRTPREVQNWCANRKFAHDPCPHEVVTHKGAKGERRIFKFNIDEVETWLRRQGMDVVRGHAGGQERGSTDLFDSAYSAPIDLEGMARMASRKLEELLRTEFKDRNGEALSGEMVRLTQAIKNASGELRQLIDAIHDDGVRRGKWVDRAHAAGAIAALGQMIAVDMQSLGARLAGDVVGALIEANIIDAASADPARRAVQVCVRARTDEVRERAAESVERAAAPYQGAA